MLTQAFDRSSRFLGRHSVLLHHLVHRRSRTVDLFDALQPFTRRVADLAYQTDDTLYMHHDILCGVTGAAGSLVAGLYFFDRTADRFLNLPGGGCTVSGKAAYLADGDSEAAVLFACTDGFHDGVRRQDVRLERDIIDDTGDVGNLLCRGIDIRYDADQPLHGLPVGISRLADGLHHVVRIVDTLDILTHGDGQLLDVECDTLKATGLRFDAYERIGVADGGPADTWYDGGGTSAHLVGDTQKTVADATDSTHDLVNFIAACSG